MELFIARDKDRRLFLYYAEPIREKERFKEPVSLESFELNKEAFPEITWENSPKKVKLELITD